MIDFECSILKNSNFDNGIETPGFRNYTNKKNLLKEDIVKVGCLLLYGLLPMNTILELDYKKYKDILRFLNNFSYIPKDLLRLIEGIFNYDFFSIESVLISFDKINFNNSNKEFSENVFNLDKNDIRNKISESINNIIDSILIENKTIFLPSDPHIYDTNKLSVAHGFSGILYNLYILEKYTDKSTDLNNLYYEMISLLEKPNEYSSSLFMGNSGIAWVLETLGYHEISHIYIDYANKNLPKLNDLFYGKAGVGLSNLYFYKKTKEKKYLNEAKKIASSILKSAHQKNGKYYWKDCHDDVYNGYGRGSSGISLLYLYLFLETEDKKYLEIGEKALGFDIDNLTTDDTGKIGLNREPISSNKIVLSPYLYDGIAGVGSVLIRYFKVTKNNKYLHLVNKITNSLNIHFTMFPGYMRGLSGIVNFHLDVYSFTRNKLNLDIARRLASNFYLYEDRVKKGLYAGEQLIRLSNDYFTGSIGVTSTLARLYEINTHNDCNQNFFLDQYYMNLGSEVYEK